MADFHQTRQDLRAARAAAEAAADALAAASEHLRRIEADEAALDRVFDPGDQAHVHRRAELKEKAAAAKADRDQGLGTLDGSRAKLKTAFEGFSAFTDPRIAVGQLADAHPILLFPVRLETRFKTVPAGPAGPAQAHLWLRVYPDTCSIDTFEATLSDAEVESARAYWTGIWQAGGIEDQERGAWRGLVASHGAGRAAWITKTYQPVNLAEKPVKPGPEHVILAIPAEAALDAGEASAAAGYWEAVWTANGDKAGEAQAFAALEEAVPPGRAEAIVAGYRPVNLARDPEPAPPPPSVEAAFVIFPPAGTVETKSRGWTRAPKAALLPDRFVFIGYTDGAPPLVAMGGPVASPLVAGPDPSADPADQLRRDGAGGLVIPDEMRWMTDFERAVEAGMGFRISLDAAYAKGFRRVLVLGVRLGADAEEAKAELETLLAHHRYGRSGLSLVPQGTPTNNTEQGGADYTRTQDADASFDDLRAASLFAPSADWLAKRDGQWLAEILGIDPATLATVRHAGGTDQAEARAINVALWPATLGYFMESMLAPLFSDATVEQARAFFTSFVSGRGMLPALRIGNQPYGIVPATAFSRMRWLDRRPGAPVLAGVGEDPVRGFARGLYELLKRVDPDWTAMAGTVSRAGGPGDPHQVLLDVLGLHPASVEFHQRYALSLKQLAAQLKFAWLGGIPENVLGAALDQGALDLLARLGARGLEEKPEILTKYFFGKQNLLKGPLVDDRPLSETDPIRGYTDDGRNYLAWLADTARSSLDELRLQAGFKDGKAPTALLYLMLRHAMELGAHDAALRLYREHALLDDQAVRQARREAPFLHIDEAAAQSESRYRLLYAVEPAITQDPARLVGSYIANSLGKLLAARYLTAQVEAIEVLEGTPTARLERVLVEHLDCCGFRLDAWWMGLLHFQLAGLRGLGHGSPAPPRTGLHLGAFAWLENLAPEQKTLTPAALDPALAAALDTPGAPPLMRDSANQGFVHAPSLNQAIAGAVLRNGYVSNADPARRDLMAVNLTSERVRTALSLLEGIRGGQSLGALLGYRFERGLHDRHGLAEVDKFIYDLRKAFPLRANRLASTRTPEGVPIEAIEARNVLDGFAFMAHVKTTGQKSYPFGRTLPAATATERVAIDAEAMRLLEAYDAVADLALSEGVYQAVLGNYDRVASTLDSWSKGHFPPEPEVVRTPASGLGLSHRVGLHLDPAADPAVSPVPGLAMTPRAQAEPAVNRWLAGLLPPLGTVACVARWTDPAGNPGQGEVTLLDLGLQAIDLVSVVPDDPRQAMAELDDRVVRQVMLNHAVRPDGGVAIAYRETLAAALPLFAVLPLVRALRRIVRLSRPLQASDLALGGEASRRQDEAVTLDPQRIVLGRNALQTLRGDLAAFLAPVDPLLADPETNRAALLAAADGIADALAGLLPRAAAFGMPHAGWGFAYLWRERQFLSVRRRIAERLTRWADALTRFDILVAAYAALPANAADQEKIDHLRRAEREVSTAQADPPSADPDGFRDALLLTRAAFQARRDAFAAVLAGPVVTVSALLAAMTPLLPVTDIDREPLGVEDEVDQTVVFVMEARAVAAVAMEEADRRLDGSQGALATAAATAGAADQVRAVQAAGKALFGQDFAMVPAFTLPEAQGEEFAKALAKAQNPAFLNFLTTTEGVDFPVDEWLYGVARVREKMRLWEETMMLAGGFGLPEPTLVPAQLPVRAGEQWLALQIPPTPAVEGERLLYTAHLGAPFAKGAPACGLLLDEWGEVIPAAEVTTGIAFHHDRPNAEAPQAMLLVTPSDMRGRWQWDDLVDALNETLDMAKKRAVEPGKVDDTAYARFLPATIAAVTFSGLSISMNLAVNNGVHEVLMEP